MRVYRLYGIKDSAELNSIAEYVTEKVIHPRYAVGDMDHSINLFTSEDTKTLEENYFGGATTQFPYCKVFYNGNQLFEGTVAQLKTWLN